jgi:hypothetical protein
MPANYPPQGIERFPLWEQAKIFNAKGRRLIGSADRLGDLVAIETNVDNKRFHSYRNASKRTSQRPIHPPFI